ncbi:shikimate kinase [Cohnella cholangitidis]|uniref:Shikimate kinase n=1 Tax=Cohnella cholangitidis TaxID=2598458 RepID=A0A7G5BTN6_9BACL|nr:shikimate kinase [Cohnella cholangitidis]QMV40320.1 shikimate kinase [Cohnella cholangitidis]
MSGLGTNRNIIIVGFMGTGKSTVSRLLSERLGWESKDTDEEIERLAGRSIKQMFAEDGEQVFRDWESRVLKDILSRGRQVVATGGGAVLRESNRRAMLSGGWVVSLTADKASLIRRVTSSAAAGTRPLLAGDAEERVSTLLETRRHAYDFAHVAVDTSKRSPAEVAELLASWLPESWN